MPEYVVLDAALSLAAVDDSDPYGHHEYSAGDVVELPDGDRTAGLVAAGSVQAKKEWEDAQIDPASLPPSGVVAQGRGDEGDAPILANEDPKPKNGK